MIDFLESVQQKAAARPRRIVFPEAGDQRVAAAVAALRTRKLVAPIVVENPSDHARFEQYAETLFTLRKPKGLSWDGAREAMRDPLNFAAMMVRHGDADGSVAGAVRTSAAVLRAAIIGVGAAPGIRHVSSAFYMVVPGWEEVITFTDASVIPEPDEEQLADIAEAAAVARVRIVGDQPRVAFLSFSTHGSAAAPSPARMR
ncbi:MAG: phosphate acyltransferase, partial [Gemmatimonadota bacterium]